MPLEFFQVDAFTDRPFAGNPAAVFVLDAPCDERWMQSVAMEMNLAETAFLHRTAADRYALRWFTPTVEVDLCGHATLASMHVLIETGAVALDAAVTFETRSGELGARRSTDGLIELDFPSTPPSGSFDANVISEAIGATCVRAMRTPFDVLAEVESPAALRSLAPDIGKVKQIEARGLIVTSLSDDPRYDFLSRFFAPQSGVNEDPVTGSAHCALAPFWSARLNKTQLTGYQASPRGGVVRIRLVGDRAHLGGTCVTIFRGELGD